MKYNMCKDNNIQLLQIFDDDWIYKSDIIKSMILNKFGKTDHKIFARKTKVEIITDDDTKAFLIENHIQGYTRSTIKLGLYFMDELVSVMTFIKSEENYVLNRFATKLNNNVIGGASKLFKYFIKNYKYEKIISFSNNLYSTGDLYYILNFKKNKDLKEDYSYIVDGKRQHKFNYRKEEKLKKVNLLKIYDAGKIKFIYS
ncbi:MAG: hypothetical protein M0R46_13885 [Candidatus Muirbacterium halophilum]|nr:hypothetical protein [Candidatus Muirbacterium halophilum]